MRALWIWAWISPASSPARNLVSKLTGAFQHKSSPQVAAAATGANNSNWEEF